MSEKHRHPRRALLVHIFILLNEVDILTHVVYHTISLNAAKNQLEGLTELKRIDQSYLDEEIMNVPWPQELKVGRIPTVTVLASGKLMDLLCI